MPIELIHQGKVATIELNVPQSMHLIQKSGTNLQS
ncbi:MAG: hypothetical protein CM15mP12_7480 [Gammaproteobacteria bacterium]|nr:MAG: hypothetical protein CM15mP12_7480 [Gammaproteobacteria bacterium]